MEKKGQKTTPLNIGKRRKCGGEAMAKTASNQPKEHKKARQREKAIALYSAGFSQTEISKNTGVARSTISEWLKKHREENPDTEIDAIRTQKKNEFVSQAWEILRSSMDLLQGRVQTALEHEAALDDLIRELEADPSVSQNEKKALIGKIRALQTHNIRDISTVIGTIYDKQALAQGETTQNIGGFELNIKVVE